MRRLRIAYVAMRWDYGDPTRGLSFEEMTFRSALEGMGHEVHAYDFMARSREVGRRRMNAELSAFVRDLHPELAFFCLFTDEIERGTIAALTESGITTYNWFADDHWRFENFSQKYAPAFSLISTTDRAALEKYSRLPGVSAVLTQWACNHYAYYPRASELRYDVTFIGQRYGDRPKVVARLREAGFDVRCWGYGWDTGRATHDEMVEIFCSSRINLNLSNSWGGRLWRRHAIRSQIKGRTFEVPGCGGFLLTDCAPYLEEYLAPGEEIGTFSDTDDLVEQVGYWMHHEDERARAARAGYERVVREHTYDHRFAEIFRGAGLAHG